MNKIKNIYLFANMGFLNQLPKSGGQTSARRVMEGLRQSGFKVIPIRRHRAELEGKWEHKLEIGFFAIYDALKIMAKMFFASRKSSVFLHLTYAGPLVPYELFLTRMVKMMGFPAMEYLKGGQVMDLYPKSSTAYKAMFKKNLDLQCLVMFEGEASMKLAASVSDTKMIHFPNYIFDDKIPLECPSKPEGVINICYFGRISPDKNNHIGVEAFNILCERHPNWNLHYTIVGGKGKSAAYVDRIEKMIADSPYKERITRVGNSTQSFLIEMMKRQHFFLFPSKEPCEGHSNALNEAMSQGLIPIVSDYHFNRAIVGDDRCVVNDFDSESYVKAIESIVENNQMKEISYYVWEHVKKHFSYSRVNKNIVDTIKQL